MFLLLEASISKLRRYINKQTANTFAVSLVHSRLDYCNSALSGLLDCHLYQIFKLWHSYLAWHEGRGIHGIYTYYRFDDLDLHARAIFAVDSNDAVIVF